VLPAVSSLAALRRDAVPSRGDRAIIGFGNPLLDGDQGDPRYGGYFRQQAQIARARSGCAIPADPNPAARARAVPNTPAAALQRRGGPPDLDLLRAQTPLPETADELCEVIRSVGGGDDDARLGARASEAEV